MDHTFSTEPTEKMNHNNTLSHQIAVDGDASALLHLLTVIKVNDASGELVSL